MTTRIYTVTTTFGSFRFSADLVQASAPIYSEPDTDGDEGGFSTPFQTADARHFCLQAAVLLLGYFGRRYWLSPDAEIGEDEDGDTTFDGLTERAYIRSLIVSVDDGVEVEAEHR